MKTVLYALITGAILLLSSCKKENSDIESTGVVTDLTGRLDGCTWLIALDNGSRLEIHSLPAGITLVDGKRVAVTYSVNKTAVSICMAGTIADIKSLRYL